MTFRTRHETAEDLRPDAARNPEQDMQNPAQPPTDACLFFDVDGTLLELAPTPDAVQVPPALIDDLRCAEAAFCGALALVSGRSIADLDRLFAPLLLNASGVHGAEFRLSGDRAGPRPGAEPLPEHAWKELLTVLERFPDMLTENKAFSYAVHYRAVPERGPELRQALQRFLDERPDLELEILPGHCIYELKRPGVDKGAAIRAFMEAEPFAGRVPIFVGDDVTDAPGFTAAKALGGHGYSVLKPFPDVDGTFSGPAAVRQWLAQIGRESRTG